MAFLSLSGDQSRYLFRLPSMILPFERNSVGAPYETPIICPAHPPRIFSSSVARERRREAPCWGRAEVGASATHSVKAVSVSRILWDSPRYVRSLIARSSLLEILLEIQVKPKLPGTWQVLAG